MGNRATIEVKDHASTAPCYIYLHWDGNPDKIVRVVKSAAPNMRRTDCNYALARLIGHYHNRIMGGLSLGVTAHKEHWDYGHYVIDLAKGTIENEGVVVASDLEFGHF